MFGVKQHHVVQARSLTAQLGCPLSRWSAAVMDIPGVGRVSDIPVDNPDATSRDGSYAANGRFFPRFARVTKSQGCLRRVLLLVATLGNVESQPFAGTTNHMLFCSVNVHG